MATRSAFPSFLAPLTKLSAAVKDRGWKGALIQLYTIGDLKFGDLKGTDKLGNKYYENRDLPYGQHRWVEYANIHNPDCAMIPPEWHGWMHHTYDEPPHELPPIAGTHTPIAQSSDAVFNSHVGLVDNSEHSKYEQHNVSQYRRRGYNIGSLMSKASDPEAYYKQPGHPLSPLADKGGRFKTLKGLIQTEEEVEEKK